MFAKRTSNDERIRYLAEGRRPIINLGSSQCRIEGIWNEARVVEPLLTPKASRALLGSLMPTNHWSGTGYFWLKGAGRGGTNKEKLFITGRDYLDELKARAQWTEGDIQQHIDGQEYRVITVGEKVVQVTKRDGGPLASDRVYEWVGVSDAPPDVKEMAREASRMLSSDKTIIGWDVIRDPIVRTSYILEGNSCPGANTAPSNRILDAVEGIGYQ